MHKKEQPKVLSKMEEDLINALKNTDTVGLAAQKVGIKTKKAYNVLYRLRKKYVKARRFVNKIDAQKKCGLVAMVLTDRMTETTLQRDLEPREETEEKWQEA